MLLAKLREQYRDPASVVDDFAELGVNVKREGGLFLFKYGVLGADWQNPVTHECRGAILRWADGAWDYQSRPFDKFFNQHQGHCPVFDESEFNRRLPGFSFVEKADGSCIQVWHDDEQGEWRVSTLGTITTMDVQGGGLTFDRLFWDTVRLSWLEGSNPDMVYIYELCCEHNRIVTEYDRDHAVLLGVRCRQSGLHFDPARLGNVAESEGVRLPIEILPEEAGIATLADAQRFVESQSDSDEYGRWPEGFVLYEHGRPIAKMKNARYRELHGLCSDEAQGKKQIRSAVFGGRYDDIREVLSDRMKAYGDTVLAEANVMLREMEICASQLHTIEFGSRKDFALAVQDNAPRGTTGYYFQAAEVFMGGGEIPPASEWLAENYAKLDCWSK